MAAVIVSYKQGGEARELAEIFLTSGVHAVIVETGARAQSDEHGKVPTIHPGNVGYGAALNLGVARILDSYRAGWPRLLLLLNADCQISDTTIDQLVEVASDAATKPCAFALPQIDEFGAESDWYRVLPSEEMYFQTAIRGKRAVAAFPQDQTYPNGAAVAVSCEVFVLLRGFDPDFFLYFEETDFYLRMSQEGYKINELPNAPIVHTGAGATSRFPGWTSIELGRSAALYCRKNTKSVSRISAAYLFYATSLIVIKLARLQFRQGVRVILQIAGFAGGTMFPRYEPLVSSPIAAQPASVRNQSRKALVKASSRGSGGTSA